MTSAFRASALRLSHSLFESAAIKIIYLTRSQPVHEKDLGCNTDRIGEPASIAPPSPRSRAALLSGGGWRIHSDIIVQRECKQRGNPRAVFSGTSPHR